MTVSALSRRNRHSHIKNGSTTANVIIYTFLGLLSLIFLYPLYQVFVCSISSPSIVMARNSLMLLPEKIQWGAYEVVFQNKNIWTGFKNTLIYLFLGTCIQYFITLITAYPLSLKNLTGKKVVMIYLTITMYFGGGLIPTYLLLSQMKLINSMWVLIIPAAANVWNIIIMRTQFVNIPDELKEAAIIDGAHDGILLFRILLPLSGAVSAVLILFTSVGYWNMWFEPMIYLTKRSMYPIQSVLREILIDNNTSMASAGANRNSQAKILRETADQAAVYHLIKYANIIVSTVPILCVYPFAQKYFVKGVMIGSLKG